MLLIEECPRALCGNKKCDRKTMFKFLLLKNIGYFGKYKGDKKGGRLRIYSKEDTGKA